MAQSTKSHSKRERIGGSMATYLAPGADGEKLSFKGCTKLIPTTANYSPHNLSVELISLMAHNFP